MRDPGPLGGLAVACAVACLAAGRGPFACAGRGGSVRAGASAESAADDPTFAALASRAAADAPGMREVARVRTRGDKVELARAGGRDACVRVAFEATAPVVAKLLDGRGNVLASSDSPATGGVLGARGPVCVRKGDAVSALALSDAPDVDAASAVVPSVRWVAWESP